MDKWIKRIFDIREHNKQKLFIMLIFFLVSFAIVRSYSVFIGHGIFIRGYHIHHFYFGTLALFIGGVLGVLNNSERRLILASALIGIGIGLFMDEVGLLLNCTTDNKLCTYAFSDSGDFIWVIAILIVLLIMLTDVRLPLIKKKISDQDIFGNDKS